MALEILPAGPVRARLRAPSSKSVTNRALVLAALAEGESVIRAPLESDDTARMAEALTLLGAGVEALGDVWVVRGTGGRLAVPSRPLNAGLSGTTMRYLAAVACLADGPVAITGSAPLLRRPVLPLVHALADLGADIGCDGDLPPVATIGGGLAGGEAHVDASRSSQFVTAVLLAAPYARRPVVVRAHGLGAPAYVDMTVQLMTGWGARVERLDDTAWRVEPGGYAARDYTVEYDASAAAHLFALAVATGGSVTVENADARTLQPDAGMVAVLERMGARSFRDGDALTVSGPEQVLPVDVDLGPMPDQVSTVACLAALAGGDSTIRNVAVAREHETDRIAATAAELRGLGAGVHERPDGLVVRGAWLHGGRVRTYDDHRMAMSFAALGARVPGVVVEDPGCVAKTYPGFWDDLRAAGVGTRDAT